jgi:hypothetical protein
LSFVTKAYEALHKQIQAFRRWLDAAAAQVKPYVQRFAAPNIYDPFGAAKLQRRLFDPEMPGGFAVRTRDTDKYLDDIPPV